MITGIPTQEELTHIRNFILLPHLLTVVDKSRRDIELHQSGLKSLYIAATEALMNRISQDIKATKQALRKAEIKVWELDDDELALCYAFICRGYQDKFNLSRNSAKAELSLLLTEYVRKMERDLIQHR